jgi:hypothetical protein
VIVANPGVTPAKAPVVASIVATDGVLVLQVPPPVQPDNVTVAPVQTPAGPQVELGQRAWTVTVVMDMHPAIAYVMAAVPGDTPVTSPVAPIVATPGLPEVHAPPAVPSVNEVVEPGQTEVRPAIAVGDGATVMVNIAVPQTVE